MKLIIILYCNLLELKVYLYSEETYTKIQIDWRGKKCLQSL